MKKERGSITIITLITILFMLSFLISTYVIISNRRQAQTEIKRETQEIYEDNVEDIDEIYNSYFAEDNEVIPIYTLEQLFKVGTGEKAVINNKIYTLTSSANYNLMTNLDFKTADYEGKIPTENVTWTETVVETETLTNQITNFEYTGTAQQYIAPATGTYKLQVWGAQGGHYRESYGAGGLGGYSVGNITLQQEDILYVYVGQQGGYKTSTGTATVTDGYNGGGGASYYGGTGGGATDIRTTGGTWDNSSSLLSRIIVAGGGGGAQGRASTRYQADGGYGGGSIGGAGTYYNGNFSTTYTGKGGQQTAGGAAGRYSSYPATAGSFGKGGTAGRYTSTTYRGSGGRWPVAGMEAGGGAYRYAGGGGGSGFVWTSATASNVPSGYTPTSEYYLTDANTYSGNTSFTSTSGGTETGHSGNGYARITLISGTMQTTKEVTKQAKRWINISRQQQNGTFTGTFNYNGNKIIETDSTGKETIHS